MPKIKYHLSDLMKYFFPRSTPTVGLLFSWNQFHEIFVNLIKIKNLFNILTVFFKTESNRSAIREPMIFLNHLGYFFYFFAYCVCSLVFIFMGILFWGKVFNPTFFFCKKKKIKNCSYNSISTFFTIYKKKLWASKRTDVVVHDAFWK